MKAFKKKGAVIGLAAALLLLALLGLGIRTRFVSGSHRYGWNHAEAFQSGRWTGYYNNSHSKCFLTSWQWDGDMDKRQLTIPEELAGAQVVGLGGFQFGYAMVFDIKMPEEHQIDNPNDCAWVTESDDIAAEYPSGYPVYVFSVTLNGAIDSTGDCEDNLYYSTEDGEKIAYKVEMEFSDN